MCVSRREERPMAPRQNTRICRWRIVFDSSRVGRHGDHQESAQLQDQAIAFWISPCNVLLLFHGLSFLTISLFEYVFQLPRHSAKAKMIDPAVPLKFNPHLGHVRSLIKRKEENYFLAFFRVSLFILLIDRWRCISCDMRPPDGAIVQIFFFSLISHHFYPLNPTGS